MQALEVLKHSSQSDGSYQASAYNFFGFTPSIVSGVIFLVIFSLLTLVHVGLMVRSRTWWTVINVLGGVSEMIGWIGRLGGHFNNTGLTFYLMQQVCTVIAPVFWSATCYVLFVKIVIIVGEQFSRFRPRNYVIFFCIVDIVCLVLQAIGGGMSGQSASDGNSQTLKTGQAIYLAGISFQLVNTILFGYLVLSYIRSLNRITTILAAGGKPLQRTVIGITIASLLIILRNIFREVELGQGFSGYTATHEAFFDCLDATPMSFCFAVLAWSHPYFGINRISATETQTNVAEKRGLAQTTASEV